MKTRLTLELPEEQASFSVWFDRYDSYNGKPGFNYEIRQNGELLAQGNDLRLGRATPARDVLALEALLTFFGAYAESLPYQDSDNRDLFPASCAPLAQFLGSDYCSLLAQDLAEVE